MADTMEMKRKIVWLIDDIIISFALSLQRSYDCQRLLTISCSLTFPINNLCDYWFHLVILYDHSSSDLLKLLALIHNVDTEAHEIHAHQDRINRLGTPDLPFSIFHSILHVRILTVKRWSANSICNRWSIDAPEGGKGERRRKGWYNENVRQRWTTRGVEKNLSIRRHDFPKLYFF